MKTCTFLGTYGIMDFSLEEKINNAIKEAFSYEDEVNFIFLSPEKEYSEFLNKTWVYPFQNMCLSIVNRIKETNKTITTTLVQTEKTPINTAYDKNLRLKFLNKINKNDDINKGKWAIKKSDILICYVYPSLHGLGKELLSFAEKRNKKTGGAIKIINVADENTAKFLWSSRELLSEKSQRILSESEKVKQNLNYSDNFWKLRGPREFEYNLLYKIAMATVDIRCEKSENLVFSKATKSFSHNCIICKRNDDITVSGENGICVNCQEKVIRLAKKFSLSYLTDENKSKILQ